MTARWSIAFSAGASSCLSRFASRLQWQPSYCWSRQIARWLSRRDPGAVTAEVGVVIAAGEVTGAVFAADPEVFRVADFPVVVFPVVVILAVVFVADRRVAGSLAAVSQVADILAVHLA